MKKHTTIIIILSCIGIVAMLITKYFPFYSSKITSKVPVKSNQDINTVHDLQDDINELTLTFYEEYEEVTGDKEKLYYQTNEEYCKTHDDECQFYKNLLNRLVTSLSAKLVFVLNIFFAFIFYSSEGIRKKQGLAIFLILIISLLNLAALIVHAIFSGKAASEFNRDVYLTQTQKADSKSWMIGFWIDVGVLAVFLIQVIVWILGLFSNRNESLARDSKIDYLL